MARRKPAGKLKVIPLGGIGEIGKNITAIEYGNDIVVAWASRMKICTAST